MKKIKIILLVIVALWLLSGVFKGRNTQTTDSTWLIDASGPDNFSQDPVDKLTSYVVILGRAVGCGLDVSQPSKRVGAWIDRTWTAEQRKAQLVVLMVGMKHHAEQQSAGNSPDTCATIRKEIKKVQWP